MASSVFVLEDLVEREAMAQELVLGSTRTYFFAVNRICVAAAAGADLHNDFWLLRGCDPR